MSATKKCEACHSDYQTDSIRSAPHMKLCPECVDPDVWRTSYKHCTVCNYPNVKVSSMSDECDTCASGKVVLRVRNCIDCRYGTVRQSEPFYRTRCARCRQKALRW